MRQFKVNDELINKIKRLIKVNDNEKLVMDLNELHYADLAEIFELLEIKEVIFLKSSSISARASAILCLSKILTRKITSLIS